MYVHMAHNYVILNITTHHQMKGGSEELCETKRISKRYIVTCRIRTCASEDTALAGLRVNHSAKVTIC